MNNSNCTLKWSAGNDLERVIEPLASYICAAEQPKTALLSALKALRSEVETTNRVAIRHFRALLERGK